MSSKTDAHRQAKHLHSCAQIQRFSEGEKMNKKLVLLVIGWTLTTLILAACGSQSAATSGFPTGKFVLPDSQSEGIYFNKDGTWSGFFGDQTVAEGTYQVKDDIYTEEAGPKACSTSATYRYSFDGTNLKFELVGQDECQNRKESLDGATYVLAK
jgi:hypothetical protein